MGTHTVTMAVVIIIPLQTRSGNFAICCVHQVVKASLREEMLCPQMWGLASMWLRPHVLNVFLSLSVRSTWPLQPARVHGKDNQMILNCWIMGGLCPSDCRRAISLGLFLRRIMSLKSGSTFSLVLCSRHNYYAGSRVSWYVSWAQSTTKDNVRA